MSTKRDCYTATDSSLSIAISVNLGEFSDPQTVSSGRSGHWGQHLCGCLSEMMYVR